MKFKLPKLSNIAQYLNVLSTILFFVIILIVLFGCNKEREGFQNKKENFQNEIIDQVKSGKIDVELIEKLIKEKKLNQDDLNAIIKAVEESKKPTQRTQPTQPTQATPTTQPTQPNQKK